MSKVNSYLTTIADINPSIADNNPSTKRDISYILNFLIWLDMVVYIWLHSELLPDKIKTLTYNIDCLENAKNYPSTLIQPSFEYTKMIFKPI